MELDKVLKRYNYVKEADEFAKTQLYCMASLPTDQLLRWPSTIMNDLVDRVFSKFNNRLQYTHFTSVFKYLVLTNDKELKSKIVKMAESFSEKQQSQIKDQIWKYFKQEK